MEYWKINIEFDYQNKYWWENRMLPELNRYLRQREYQCSGFKELTALSPSNHKFAIKKFRVANKNVISLIIENNSNWKLGRGCAYPQIVKLVEDYFKINNNIWYLLETLNSQEDIQIKKEGRTISPLMILNKIRLRDNLVQPQRVDIVNIGAYNNAQTDIYKGSKENFDSILNFWISCLYWINCGKIRERDFSYFSSIGYFDGYFGSCIPIKPENERFKKVFESVYEENQKWNHKELKIALLMRKNWNDKICLIEFENEYVLHNWHTNE